MTSGDTSGPIPPSGKSSRVAIDEIATPEIRAFIEYWDSLRGDAFAPSWKAFDLSALEPKSIPYVVVADVIHDPLDFIIRFWGTAHVSRKGVDKTGRSIIAKPDLRGATAFDEYREVVEEKHPVASRDIVNLQTFSNLLPFEQSLVRLPLSDDGKNVHHVVSLAQWEKV
jgi:hypothetical protein